MTEPIDPLTATAHDGFELAAGSVVGEYRIEGKIGEGGMGIVFAARHPVIGKRAAIKILQRELCSDPVALARFLDEARVVNTIGHPNIVDIFAFGQLPDGRSYFVMEWLDGESLRRRLAGARPDLAETCHILRALARALDAAHAKGIVHRDLKPDNVCLVPVRGERPLVKLLDFGIAKLVEAPGGEPQIARTATNQMIGTPLYIAPEQARAEAVDHRADVYALGAIAFELLVGEPPFSGRTVMEVVAKHMMEPAQRASTRVTAIPPALDDAVHAMLDKEPAARPSLVELIGVLDQVDALARTEPMILRDAPIRPPTGPVTARSRPPTPAPMLPATVADTRPTAVVAPSVAAGVAPSVAVVAPVAPSVAAVVAPVAALATPSKRRRWLVPAIAGAAIAAVAVVAIVLVIRVRPPAKPEPAIAPSVPSKPSVPPRDDPPPPPSERERVPEPAVTRPPPNGDQPDTTDRERVPARDRVRPNRQRIRERLRQRRGEPAPR